MAPASKSKNFAVESAFMNELVTLFSDSDLTTLELETDEIADIAPDSVRILFGQIVKIVG